MDPIVVGFLVPPGLLCVTFLWQKPRVLVYATLIAALFIRTLTHFIDFPLLENFDDALVALTVIRALFEMSRPRTTRAIVQRFPGRWLFGLFVAAGAVSAIVTSATSVVLLSGAFLAAKGILFGWAASKFEWRPQDIQRLARGAMAVVLLILAAGFANMIAPGAWASSFSVDGQTIDRYGLPSLTGPFIHPFDFAFATAMAALAVAVYARYFGSTPLTRLVLVSCVLANIAAFRRKDTIGLLVSTAVIAVRYRRPGWPLFLLLLLPIVVLLEFDSIADQVGSFASIYLTEDSEAARTVLTLGAFRVATEYFPLGAGLGRYASEIASQYYSPEYNRLGFETVYGLRPTETFYATDATWPAIIGETGWLGATFFLLGLLALLRKLVLIERSAVSSELKWLAGTGVAWWFAMLIESTGAAIFTSPPGFPWLFSIAGVAVALARWENANESSEDRANLPQEESRGSS